MNEFDGAQFGREIVAEVKNHIARSIVPLLDEIKQLKGKIADLETVRLMPGPEGPPGPPGKTGEPGKNGSDASVVPLIEEIKQLKDKIGGLELIPGPEGPQGKVGEAGRDAIHIKTVLIDEAGDLITIMSNGETLRAGHVKGPPGVSVVQSQVGEDGHLNLEFNDGKIIDVGKVVGENGKDGRDGFGYDNMTEELIDDGRILLRKFHSGEKITEFRHPIYRTRFIGFWKDGKEFDLGDMVGYGGSMWHANKCTRTKPGSCDDWTLVVRRGRDGEKGDRGEPGLSGADGRPGRDLTQMAPDGAKW